MKTIRRGGDHIFSFDDGTGDFVNDSQQSWTSGEEIEVTKTIDALRDTQVRWKWWFDDAAGNVNVTDTWNFTVAWSHNITFDVRSGEDNSSLNNFNIYCDNGWQVSGVDSPYTAWFSDGNYECVFKKDGFYNKTITFSADTDKTINVKLSKWYRLTIEEHNWLEELYQCIINGDCTAFDLWEEINETTWDIWKEETRTNRDVITNETVTNGVLNPPGSHITIDYSVDIPYKQGYDNGALLPLRMFFWFHDGTTCYNQDKTKDAWNRAESPYCFPLVAELLGPNNGTVNFTVTLNPEIAAATYTEVNITRSIEIDPILDGTRHWINYGQEVIGTITVLSSGDAEISVEKTSESYSEEMPITGNIIKTLKGFLTNKEMMILASMLTFIISLSIICLTLYKIKKIKRNL